ncbi:MAG: hypothetical protein K9N23_06550 [Akkermansiaceae bacterium]|nr:hypothetical protein [Akkermansiaceae bacterium]
MRAYPKADFLTTLLFAARNLWLAMGCAGCCAAQADVLDLVGPPGSGTFGTAVLKLPNGNFVVTDPGYDLPGVASDVGAVYLFNPRGEQISKLTGSTYLDAVGSGGVFIVGSGNFVVRSPDWSAGEQRHDAGAVTWGSGTTGVSGIVSPANSLVGTKANDRVGSAGIYFGGITLLANGHYVVSSPDWGSGTANSVGAVTWGDGNAGAKGEVSAANSLVGSTLNDQIGYYRVIPLPNGNYVMRNQRWDNGAAVDAGAVTWGDGHSGSAGVVSAANSLVGSTTGDKVGFEETFQPGITVLKNGNYVVTCSMWDNGAATDAGSVTWANGATGRAGVISAANSVVGTTARDFYFYMTVTELTNGNYVVCLPMWDNGAVVDAGAAMWCHGGQGRTGTVSSANALVGNAANSRIGHYDAVTPLTNGNYVVCSPIWKEAGGVSVSAVTWCDGTTGRSGTITAANSLVGSTAGDQLGERFGDQEGLIALPGGNYLVHSYFWDNGTATNAGAVTWGDGTTGVTGPVTSANSLVGSTAGDQIGYDGMVILPNGDYVVRSFLWDNGAASNAGAVTLGNGNAGATGVVSASNSLVGVTAEDRVGEGPALAAADGAYLFSTPKWNNGSTSDAGAVMLLQPGQAAAGGLSPAAGVPGTVAIRGSSLSFDYDESRDYMIVGCPYSNVVRLFSYHDILSPTDKYEVWAAAAGLSGSDALPQGTPFVDGVENLLKYAFNMNGAADDGSLPASGAATTGLPRLSVRGSGDMRVLRVEYLRRKNSGLIYLPQFAADLAAFAPMTGAESTESVDDSWERVTVEQPADPAIWPRLFGIVEVTLP